jgi:hypothetical protein
VRGAVADNDQAKPIAARRSERFGMTATRMKSQAAGKSFLCSFMMGFTVVRSECMAKRCWRYLTGSAGCRQGQKGVSQFKSYKNHKTLAEISRVRTCVVDVAGWGPNPMESGGKSL